jgi:hypothetical protein
MSHRVLVSRGAAAVVIAVVSLTPAILVGRTSASSFQAVAAATGKGDQSRTAASKAKSSYPARTPWGDPDLQGIWTNATITPFERPTELAGKQIYTEQEAAEFEKRTNERNTVDRPPPPGNPGGYNQFWFDRGTKVVPGRQTSLVVDPPDGRIPPLAAEAQKRSTARAEHQRAHPADSWEDLGEYTRCLTRGLPNAMTPGFYNHNYQILQAPGYVAILVEMIHEARIIPLDGRPHLGPNVRQWMGDSSGRWAGNTLVVETTNFSPKAEFRGASANLRLIERFTRTDADTIQYEYTVDDPTTWTRPWTAAIPMTKDGAPEYIFEYACHEGNHAMVNILNGYRAQEKAAEEEAAKKDR